MGMKFTQLEWVYRVRSLNGLGWHGSCLNELLTYVLVGGPLEGRGVQWVENGAYLYLLDLMEREKQ